MLVYVYVSIHVYLAMRSCNEWSG